MKHCYYVAYRVVEINTRIFITCADCLAAIFFSHRGCDAIVAVQTTQNEAAHACRCDVAKGYSHIMLRIRVFGVISAASPQSVRYIVLTNEASKIS